MYNGEKYHQHIGVYGVHITEDRLLCIRKNAGPYQNRYDLPGGSQEDGEGLTETLTREVLEETGHKVSKYGNNRIYDSFVKSSPEYTTHHIFALYDIQLSENEESIPEIVEDGKNDSNGIEWVPITELNAENSSPLILKVLDEVQKDKKVLEKSIFLSWEVKDNF